MHWLRGLAPRDDRRGCARKITQPLQRSAAPVATAMQPELLASHCLCGSHLCNRGGSV
jgi:hypothetical protein